MAIDATPWLVGAYNLGHGRLQSEALGLVVLGGLGALGLLRLKLKGALTAHLR